MALTPDRLRVLVDLLVSCYDPSELQNLVRVELEELRPSVNWIQPIKSLAVDVIDEAEKRGLTRELVIALKASRPHVKLVQQFCDAYLVESAPSPELVRTLHRLRGAIGEWKYKYLFNSAVIGLTIGELCLIFLIITYGAELGDWLSGGQWEGAGFIGGALGLLVGGVVIFCVHPLVLRGTDWVARLITTRRERSRKACLDELIAGHLEWVASKGGIENFELPEFVDRVILDLDRLSAGPHTDRRQPSTASAIPPGDREGGRAG